MPNFGLPEPLRGCEPGSFAESTVRVRLRDIGLRTLRENAFSEPVTAHLKALIADLPDGRIRPLLEAEAPDLEDWQGYVKPYLGQSWLEVPWFFAETYFYRRLLEATGYYGEDSPRVDPYRLQKRLGLEQNLTKIREACDFTERLSAQFCDSPLTACTLFSELMLLSLWGNQADLSIWPVGQRDVPDERTANGLTSLTSNLLVDDLTETSLYLCELDRPRIDMILDNCGLELVNDLLAASLLLDLNLAGSVVLHAKFHPTFVSDAILLDIQVTLEFLCVSDDPCIRRAGELIQAKIDSGKLRLQDDPYWNSPLAFWYAPDRVIQDLNESNLVISKGDANYRRFLGDRHWPYDFPAQAAFGYLPFPFLGLRVCKSEVMVGLRADQVESMNSTEPGWMVNGRWGIVQFVDSRNRRE